MCEQNYIDTVQLIPYTLVIVCANLPRHCKVTHRKMGIQNYINAVQLIPYTKENVCTKLRRLCAVYTLHASKYVCLQICPHTVQLISYTQVNVCTKLPRH